MEEQHTLYLPGRQHDASLWLGLNKVSAISLLGGDSDHGDSVQSWEADTEGGMEESDVGFVSICYTLVTMQDGGRLIFMRQYATSVSLYDEEDAQKCRSKSYMALNINLSLFSSLQYLHQGVFGVLVQVSFSLTNSREIVFPAGACGPGALARLRAAELFCACSERFPGLCPLRR